jgi:hypothetical protein
VTGIGALDGVHRERADGIGKFAASWHGLAGVLSVACRNARHGAARVEKGARIFHYPATRSNHDSF